MESVVVLLLLLLRSSSRSEVSFSRRSHLMSSHQLRDVHLRESSVSRSHHPSSASSSSEGEVVAALLLTVDLWDRESLLLTVGEDEVGS